MIKEGQDLKHCVGGYTRQCLGSNSHIVSVRTPQGKAISTLEFITDYDKKECQLIQHYGIGNNTPTAIPLKIEKAIRKSLNSEPERQPTRRGLKKIPQRLFNINNKTINLDIDYESIQSSKKDRDKVMQETPGGMVIRDLGFDPRNPDTVNNVIGSYEKVIAPTGQKVKDHTGDEVENFGLDVRKKLRDNFKKLKNLSSIDISPHDIAGKSSFNLEKKEQKTKKEPRKKGRFSDALLVKKMQSSIQKIFPECKEGDICVNIDNPADNKFGETFFTLSENVSVDVIKDKIEEIFQDQTNLAIEYKEDERQLQIKNITAKHCSDMFEGYCKKLPQSLAI